MPWATDLGNREILSAVSRAVEWKGVESARGELGFEKDLVVLGLKGPLWAVVGFEWKNCERTLWALTLNGPEYCRTHAVDVRP